MALDHCVGYLKIPEVRPECRSCPHLRQLIVRANASVIEKKGDIGDNHTNLDEVTCEDGILEVRGQAYVWQYGINGVPGHWNQTPVELPPIPIDCPILNRS